MFSKIRNARILRKQTITEATIIISVIALLSKVVGYARDVLSAKYFGTSYQVDAFVVASLIPTMVLGLFSGGMQAIAIRMYAEKKEQGFDKARVFINQIFFVFSVVLLVITALLVIFSRFSVKLVAFGFTGDRLALASSFTKYLAIFGYLNIMVGFFTGVFQVEKQFFYPALIGLLANVSVPFSIWLFSPSIGIYSKVVGQDAFGLLYFMPLYLFLAIRWGFFKRFDVRKINWADIGEFTRLMLPAIVISGMSVIYQITDKTVASFLPAGAIAGLDFAQTVYMIPYGLLAASVAVSVYPSLSSYAVQENNEGYVGLLNKSIFSLSYIMAPISAVFTVYSTVIVKILFQRGAFDANSTAITSACVSMYSLGLFGISLADIYRRVFFSFKDIRTPMNISIISAALNLIFDIVLAKYMGASGIALATTIVTFASLFFYIIYFRRKRYVKGFRGRIIYIEIIKIAIASIAVGFAALLLKRFIPLNLNLIPLVERFSLIVIVLAIFYILLTALLKTVSFKLFISFSSKFIGKKTK
ncbi:MAG: murein biosynthesis integral membrane protein MurJ [Caldisericaceae bacterium]